MRVLETENKTFNKTVKRLIATTLPRVKTFKRYNRKTYILRDENEKLIATWNGTLYGSYVRLSVDY